VLYQLLVDLPQHLKMQDQILKLTQLLVAVLVARTPMLEVRTMQGKAMVLIMPLVVVELALDKIMRAVLAWLRHQLTYIIILVVEPAAPANTRTRAAEVVEPAEVQ